MGSLNIKVEADKKLNPKIKKVLSHKKNTHLNFCHVYILKVKELYCFGDSKSPFNLISFKASFLLNKIHKHSTAHSWPDVHSTNISSCRVWGEGRKDRSWSLQKEPLYTYKWYNPPWKLYNFFYLTHVEGNIFERRFRRMARRRTKRLHLGNSNHFAYI